MDPRNLSELVPYLKKESKLPKKSLSQNFLIEKSILEKIARIASVQPGDHILEIGPGPGCLTKTLLEKGAHVDAVEIDQRFCLMLESIIDSEKFSLYQADFLEFLCQKKQKVVANIPYHLTSPIIEKLALHKDLFSECYLTVAEDLAKRICAKKNERNNSSFSLFVQYYFDPKIECIIPKNAFYPRPKIDSAVISLKRHHRYSLKNPEKLFQVIQKAFQKRRKMLRGIFKECNLPESWQKLRPENLSLEDFISIFSNFFDV